MKISNAMRLMCPMVADRGNNEDNRCVGAGCMAWRWHNNESGYCGMAGEPKNTAGSGVARPADIGVAELGLVEKFLDDRCQRSNNDISAIDLWNTFKASYSQCMTQKRFGQIIGAKFNRIKRGGVIYCQGLELV